MADLFGSFSASLDEPLYDVGRKFLLGNHRRSRDQEAL